VQRSARLPILIILALAGRAFADDGDDAVAEAKAKFEHGRELVKAGNSAEACPLFEESMRLAPALGTKLNLAICWAAIGRLVDAQRLFEVLVKETEVAEQPQRLQLAREGLEGVKDRVPHLKINASALPEGEAIELDGKTVDASVVLPVDPGHHTIHAAHAMPVEILVAEGKQAEITLEAIASHPRPQQVLYFGGAAAGALLISALTGIAVINERDNALHHCATSPTDGSLLCSQRGIDLLDRAHTMSHVSTAFLVTGAALAAFTAVLELKWRRSNEAPIATAWTAPHTVGVALEAAW
jgi:tetratricopeptide (TPR) repeat protein